MELLKWLPPIAMACWFCWFLWGVWRKWGELSGQRKLEDHHGWQNHGWRTCIEKDGVEERTHPSNRWDHLALKPCKFCGANEADQTREIFRKWWWLMLLVPILLFIVIMYGCD